MRIEMRKLNHFINKPFANGFCVFESSKLKMYQSHLHCFDVNLIITLILLYRYTFYALLKKTFGERVRMLYTETDLFYLHFFVEDLTKISTRALTSETPSTLAR